jgi:hypothetical protein
MVQPPALRRAHPPMAGGVIIEDEQRHHRAGPRGSGNRGMIGKPQIVAKPDEMGC